MSVHYENIGKWVVSRKEHECHQCRDIILRRWRYWRDEDMGPTCEFCATMVFIGSGGRQWAMADPEYAGQLIDYLGNGKLLVTPKQARELDYGITSEYDRA